jgi:hypothetical protein
MADVDGNAAKEAVSRSISRVGWGLLLIWVGAVVLLSWGWGIGALGAGAIMLGAQAVRRYRQIEVEGFGLVAGALFVICGVASLFRVPVDLFPVLCILAGIALLVQAWTARAHHAPPRQAEVSAPPPPRA